MARNCTDPSICRYFLRGYCRFGAGCWFKHETPLCWNFQRGSCFYGQRCRYRHILVPKMGPGDDAAAAVNDQKKEPDVTCSICMENIYEMKKTFGILPNCVHAFCEPCIVTWRRMDRYHPDVVKGCPVCRVRSDFYVPSESMMEGEKKEQLITSTKQRCREDFCSFFDESGLCPFEEDCRYLTARRHEHQENDDGEDDVDNEDDEDYEDEDYDTSDEDVQVYTTVIRMDEQDLRVLFIFTNAYMQ